MDIKLQVDTSQLKALTHDQLRKQGSFAFAKSLTDVGYIARKATQQQLPRWLKLTKQFIPKSVVVERATVKNMIARVGFLERVPLINLMEEGGTRKPSGRAIAVPYKYVKRNGKGGITKANRPRQLLAKKNVFSETIGGVSGIWKRQGKKLTLLYAYEEKTEHDPKKIRFKDTVEGVVRKNLVKTFSKNFDHAIRTMKK